MRLPKLIQINEEIVSHFMQLTSNWKVRNFSPVTFFCSHLFSFILICSPFVSMDPVAEMLLLFWFDCYSRSQFCWNLQNAPESISVTLKTRILTLSTFPKKIYWIERAKKEMPYNETNSWLTLLKRFGRKFADKSKFRKLFFYNGDQ